MIILKANNNEDLQDALKQMIIEEEAYKRMPAETMRQKVAAKWQDPNHKSQSDFSVKKPKNELTFKA